MLRARVVRMHSVGLVMKFHLFPTLFLLTLGCVDETDICVGHHYELVILEVPPEIDEMTFHLEFESQTIDLTCTRESDDSCRVATDHLYARGGLETDTGSAWVRLDDYERATSHVPREIRVVLSSPEVPDFAADRTFTPDIETTWGSCESAQDVWSLG